MDSWQPFLAIGALLTPIVLAAMARDRSLLVMLNSARQDALNAIVVMKDDARRMIAASTEPLHDRVNRVRDEYVRRDDLDGHLARMGKQFDDIRDDMRRNSENLDKRLDEIRKLLQTK